MKAELYPWYQERLADSMITHPVIPGYVTNSHVVLMDKIEMDHFADKRAALIAEMQDVLEWWTGTQLYHTTTFGVRIYRRGSFLVNHLDRQKTHIASAVLQVAQSGGE